MFGFLPAKINADSNAIFFTADSYEDYITKGNSYVERPDQRAYTYSVFYQRDDDAMAYGLYRILSKISKKDIPIVLVPDPGIDRYQIECDGKRGQDPVVVAHQCRSKAISICHIGGGSPYNISTTVEPDGQGGYCATTTYECSHSR